MTSHVEILLRITCALAIISGLIGGLVWLVDLEDRSDGDDLRWGFWHNPFMGFRPFNETFLELSMWALLACSAFCGLGGLLLLTYPKVGILLVTWQARVSVAINSVIGFSIIFMTLGLTMMPWEKKALVLRCGSAIVDLTLWTWLTCDAVREFLARGRSRGARGFEVISESP